MFKLKHFVGKINFRNFKVLNNKRFCVKEEQLRDVQMTSKYEAAISSFVIGDYNNAIKFLNDLKKDMKDEKKENTNDYEFLIKKLITFHKANGDLKENKQLLIDLFQNSLKIHRDDFNTLFDITEYVIINLIHADPPSAIEFITKLVDDEVFPNFFNQIFNYYLGVYLYNIDNLWNRRQDIWFRKSLKFA